MVTARADLERCLDVIDRLDGDVGAFTHVAADEARAQADLLDAETAAGRSRGPLHGCPVGVKEIVEVAGWPHTAGSLIWEGRVGERDAELVRRLRAAGAVLVGLTRSHELAWGVTTQHARRGSTSNPAAPGRVPGGSSGGSGAAVAAGMVPLAVGTDTGGSVRIPASFCGVHGIRPTLGLLPADGIVPLARSFDAPGFLATDAELLATAMGAVVDGFTVGGVDPVQLRVGVPPAIDPPAGAAQAAAVDSVVDVLRRAGCTVVEVRLLPGADVMDAFVTVQRAEVFALHSGELGTWPAHADLLTDDVRLLMETASRVTPEETASARRAIDRIRADVGDAITGVDVLVAPAVGCPPSTLDDQWGPAGDFRPRALAHTVLQSVLGAPGAVVPAGVDEDGVPVGVQLWSAPGRDATVLAVAALVDRLRGSRPSVAL